MSLYFCGILYAVTSHKTFKWFKWFCCHRVLHTTILFLLVWSPAMYVENIKYPKSPTRHYPSNILKSKYKQCHILPEMGFVRHLKFQVHDRAYHSIWSSKNILVFNVYHIILKFKPTAHVNQQSWSLLLGRNRSQHRFRIQLIVSRQH